MRNNKAILDEAARSVRRTFVGSVAGSIGMLAVVGAAGAYGMPEKLTAQALAAAMAKFNVKFPASWSTPRRRSSGRCRSPTTRSSRRVAGDRRRAGRRRSFATVPQVAPAGCRRRPLVDAGCAARRPNTSVVAKTFAGRSKPRRSAIRSPPPIPSPRRR